jgi:hypothetical protein
MGTVRLAYRVAHLLEVLMMLLPLTPIVVIVLLAAPATLRAQMSNSAVESRLRVTMVGQPDAPLIGTAVQSSDSTLYLRRSGSSDTIAIQRSRIQRVEISSGSRGHLLVGMLVGGAAGAASLAAADRCTNCFGGQQEAAIVGGVGGLLIGGIVGELIRTERWKSITPTVAWRSTPGQTTKTLALGVQMPW